MRISKSEAIMLIDKKISEFEIIYERKSGHALYDGEYKKIFSGAEHLVTELFSEDEMTKFRQRVISGVLVGSKTFAEELKRYQQHIERCIAVLEAYKVKIEHFWSDNETEVEKNDPLSTIEHLCSKFHLVARQLKERHEKRETLSIEDEYDVQDLLHALLKIYFDDIRPEEYTPSYATKSSRMDFLLKKEKTVIEVKKTRDGLDSKKLADQLVIDIKWYQSHPECEKLFCFVYDPEERILNPISLEEDLAEETGNFRVKVLVAPR